MEQTKILLIFKDGIVNLDDVSDLRFFAPNKGHICQVRFRNGKGASYFLYKAGKDIPLTLPTIPFAVMQIAIFTDSEGNITAERCV